MTRHRHAGERQVFAQVPPGRRADGMTGCRGCVCRRAGRLVRVRYDHRGGRSAGGLGAEVCVGVGADWSDLYVTTAAVIERDQGAGRRRAVVLRPGVRGAPEYRSRMALTTRSREKAMAVSALGMWGPAGAAELSVRCGHWLTWRVQPCVTPTWRPAGAAERWALPTCSPTMARCWPAAR
jgi:hypothetical protein